MPNHLKVALESVLSQTSDNYEVLLGFDGQQPDNVIEIINDIVKNHPHGFRVHQYQFNHGGISKTTNALAKMAQNDFLILVDHDDWVRCDLTYRYDLTYNLLSDKVNTVLFCYEYKFTDDDPSSRTDFYYKDKQPKFPYLFCNTICHCLCIPRTAWIKVGGLRSDFDGAQDYDICLRLDLEKVKFECVPVELYGWRVHSKSTAYSINSKSYAHYAGIKALKGYVSSKKLDWEINEGLYPTHYRAVPKSPLPNKVHVIVLYKDNKKITINCLNKLLAQSSNNLLLTFVSNNSIDKTIKESLEKANVEVLISDGPFNFSKLNNYASQKSKYANLAEATLFLNNDCFLEEDAVEELQSWIFQPKIGAVGAKLSYEDGTTQHSGIIVDDDNTHLVHWSKDSSEVSIHITQAITAACLMIRTKIFHEIGGFDEVNFPISGSDTDLCRQLRNRDFYCIYTPYAEAIHLESKTRGFSEIEDFEFSKWFHRITDFRNSKWKHFGNNEFLDSKLDCIHQDKNIT